MATAKTTDAVKQLTYLAGALKAPRILDVAGRLADQAREDRKSTRLNSSH